MRRNVFFHEGHGDDDVFGVYGDFEGGDDGELPWTWGFDNVELVTVGVDVGSSTSHLLFARLHLQRLTQSLSSRFVVVKREVLHRSPILLTPYRPDGLIDVDVLADFFREAYAGAGLKPEDIDTGAVILTGAALERANSEAVAELFAEAGGKFVCASAGHNMEGILAAQGSGAAALSRQMRTTLLHIDIGGGTSKVALLHDGEVLQTSAIHVGGRLVAMDEAGRVVRIEPSAKLLAEQLGIRVELGQPLSAEDRKRLADMQVEILLQYVNNQPLSDLAKKFLLTEPLDFSQLDQIGDKICGVTFSGGVSEYIYGREGSAFGDIALELASGVRQALDAKRFPADMVNLGEGIRATVLGASQFSVQLSGNTVHISNPDALPLRNLPVVYARVPQGPLDEGVVTAAIQQGFRRLDLIEGDIPVAIALPWHGEPYYQTLRALASGVAAAVPNALKAGFPLVLALDGDIGRSLGGILSEEFGVETDLISVDGLQLLELDYVDIGEVIQPANVVPVVVKSLAFPGSSHHQSHSLDHGDHDHDHDHEHGPHTHEHGPGTHEHPVAAG